MFVQMKENAAIPIYPIAPATTASFMIREVTRPGYVEKKEHVGIPHRHEFYSIAVVEKGYGKHLVDFKEYSLDPCTLHIIAPYQVHHVHNDPGPEQPVKGMVLFFTRDFIQSHPLLDELEWIESRMLLSSDEMELMMGLCRQLLAEYTQPQPLGSRIIRDYLDILLSQISRVAALKGPAAEQTHEARVVKELQVLIGQHYQEEKSPAAYAGMLNVSVGHLSDVVKQQTGKTTSQLIAERVILEAKRLLVHTQDSVKEIAYRLNFNEATYFYKYFKKHTNETPERFRELMQEAYRLG